MIAYWLDFYQELGGGCILRGLQQPAPPSPSSFATQLAVYCLLESSLLCARDSTLFIPCSLVLLVAGGGLGGDEEQNRITYS